MPQQFIDEFGRLIEVGLEEDIPSDFEDMTDDLTDAHRTENGDFHSDIAASARFQQIRQARQGEDAAAVNINPVSVIKNNDPKLGNVLTVTAGLTSQEALRWEGTSSEARVCTVLLNEFGGSAQGDFTVGNSGDNRPFALVRWGTRNNLNLATVDVGKGCQFSLVASCVYVSLGLDGTTGGTMTLGASLGFFGAPRTAPITRTIYQAALVPTGTASFTIPVFSRQLLPIQRAFAVSGMTNTPAAITLDVKDVKGNVIYSIYGNDSLYTIMSSPLPLSNDAYSMTVTNTDVALTIPAMRFIFELGF